MRQSITYDTRSGMFKKYALLFIVLLLAFWLVLFLLSFPWSPRALVYAEPVRQADAIVFLTPDPERIDYALELYQKGIAPVLFTPGVQNDFFNRYLQEKADSVSLNSVIIAGNGAESTYEEALLTRDFVYGHGLRSIVLVTSNYHSYRAHWIFRKVMPHTQITSAPVPNAQSWFKPGSIKQGTYSEKIFHAEQLKFLWYYLAFSWRIYV